MPYKSHKNPTASISKREDTEDDSKSYKELGLLQEREGTSASDKMNGDSESEFDDDDETETSKCIWKITPAESLYDFSMLRFLLLSRQAGVEEEKHLNCWGLFQVLVLLFFNGALQLTVVARVRALVQNTRADRVDSVYAPTGNCMKHAGSLYSHNSRLGAHEWNWDCGPMYPLLFANSSFLDVNNDKFWSEADEPEDLGNIYNAKFHKQGDLGRIFSEFLEEAVELKFITQVNESIGYEQSKILTNNFTRIPMKWMVDQQPISSLCNNVDPELCGNLEVRGILKDHFPNEPSQSRRMRKCRETWDWCVVKFGELFKNYKMNALSTCESVSPNWDEDDMLTIVRYDRADKYDPRVNPRAIVSPIYESFLLLVLVIWWLAVLQECRTVLCWWMTILTIPHGKFGVAEDDEKIEVYAMSWKAKALILIFVLLPRTIVIVGLSWIGTDFLITADSYGDLILNSVALGFLIEVDEMVFSCMASEVDQVEFGKLQPIEAEHSCSQGCIDFNEWQNPMCLLMVVFLVPMAMATLSYILPFGKIELTEAYQCLCHMEGDKCIVAQLFGHEMEVPSHYLGVAGTGRAGKGR